MDQKSITTSPTPDVSIELIGGNLQLKGWERNEVLVRARPDATTLEEVDDAVTLSCTEDATIRLPQGSSLHVEQIRGNARFKLLDDQLEIEQVQGALVLRNVADVRLEAVHGELLAKEISGDLRVELAAGNVEVRQVQGDCLLDDVHGNLDLRDVIGNLNATVKGNARVRLSEMTGNDYQISTEGNVHCRIPQDANLRIRLASAGEMIRVRLPGVSKSVLNEQFEHTLGSGAGSLTISAGGVIYLLGEEGSDEVESEFAAGFETIPEDLGEQISSQIEAQMSAMERQLNEQIARLSVNLSQAGVSQQEADRIMQQARASSERANTRAQEKMRRAQERMERKMEAERRRAEHHAQSSQRHAHGHGGWSFTWPPPPPPPQPPAGEQATEEERLMILRMLEQKKISLQEAEQLLSALEGKGR